MRVLIVVYIVVAFSFFGMLYSVSHAAYDDGTHAKPRLWRIIALSVLWPLTVVFAIGAALGTAIHEASK